MAFRRRTPRSWAAWLRNLFYPDGGFRRATQYVILRMRRLPDTPEKVARGVAAGVFVNFPPLFGFQFLSAALLAWAIRGNILAAMFCTFLTNPLTTPLIAIASLELGYWMLGIDEPLEIGAVLAAFSDAGIELWGNARALFTPEPMQWESLGHFFRTIFLPYTVGSILPGLTFAVASYFATVPLVAAYQRMRSRRLQERVERRLAARAAALAEALGDGTAPPAKGEAGGAPGGAGSGGGIPADGGTSGSIPADCDTAGSIPADCDRAKR
jgi:uncharacterized protein (DUF2062 family)